MLVKYHASKQFDFFSLKITFDQMVILRIFIFFLDPSYG